jgi:hypothetical protein
MEEVVNDSTSPQNSAGKKLSRNVVVNQMSENMWWRNPPSRFALNNIRPTNNFDTNNNDHNMDKNTRMDDDSELFRIDYSQDDNRPILKTQNFSKI